MKIYIFDKYYHRTNLPLSLRLIANFTASVPTLFAHASFLYLCKTSWTFNNLLVSFALEEHSVLRLPLQELVCGYQGEHHKGGREGD